VDSGLPDEAGFLDPLNLSLRICGRSRRSGHHRRNDFQTRPQTNQCQGPEWLFRNPCRRQNGSRQRENLPRLVTLGDEISVHCRNPAGKPIAAKIWANVVTFSATVKYINGDEIEVVTIPNADYAKEEHRIVHLHAHTAFGTSRKDLSVGRDVRIVGLDIGNGEVDAARIALYNTDVPADGRTRK